MGGSSFVTKHLGCLLSFSMSTGLKDDWSAFKNFFYMGLNIHKNFSKISVQTESSHQSVDRCIPWPFYSQVTTMTISIYKVKRIFSKHFSILYSLFVQLKIWKISAECQAKTAVFWVDDFITLLSLWIYFLVLYCSWILTTLMLHPGKNHTMFKIVHFLQF